MEEGKEKKEPKSALDTLRKKLNIKGYRKPNDRGFRVRARVEQDVEDTWDAEEGNGFFNQDKQARRTSFVKKVFFISLLFFILAMGIFFFVFFGGFNVISPKKVDIAINGPVSVEAGKVLELQIAVENKNNVLLKTSKLFISYPEGTRDPDKLEEDLPRIEKDFGPIRSGEIIKTTENIILFGGEGEEKIIDVSLEYQTKDSNAVFVAEKKYSVFLSASPLLLSVQSFKEVHTGNEFDLGFRIVSNSNETLHDLLVSVEYPFGFTYLDAEPKPAFGNNIWRIGDLSPGREHTITLTGVLKGQDGEDKVFRIESGIPKKDDERSIGIAYTTTFQEVVVTRPFLAVNLLLNGNELEEQSVKAGSKISGIVRWTNNLPTKITNAHIEARLEGDVLERSSVRPRRGFFRSFDNTIVWNNNAVSEFKEIQPGQSGELDFSFISKQLTDVDGRILENPRITVFVDARAERILENGVPEELKSTKEASVKIASQAAFTQGALYSTGPFVNVGSIPPKAEQETTYTVTWTLINAGNTLTSADAQATLPPYVRWIGNVSPQRKEVRYKENTRTVQWAVGTVSSGAGISRAPEEVSFQVAFLPSISQIGASPVIVSPVQFSAFDQFSELPVLIQTNGVTTKIINDPRYNEGDGRVVQ